MRIKDLSMKRLLSLLIIFFFVGQLYANDKSLRLRQVLEEEVKLSTSLLKKSKYKDKELHQRQLESMASLVKSYQRMEHDQFVKTGKKKFPKTEALANQIDESGKIYLKSQKVDLAYLKVLHLMASNQYYYLHKSSISIYYLKKILKYKIEDVEFLYTVRTTLADLYFNTERFEESEKLYKTILKMKHGEVNKNKHLYNLGWSYFKNGKTEKAINSLALIINDTNDRDDNYYQLALEKLPQFYVMSKNRKNGISFFKNLKQGDQAMLLTYSKLLFKRGHFSIGSKALSLVRISSINEERLIKDLLDIHSILYEQKRQKKFLKITLDLIDLIEGLPQKSENRLIFLSNISNYINFSKKSIYKKKYDPSISSVLTTTSFMQYLLQVLIKVDKDNLAIHYHFLGELYFYQKKYEESLHYYKEAVEITKDLKVKEKIITSMLTSLSRIKNNDSNLNFYLYTYETYLSLNLDKETTLLIFPKLLSIYLKKKYFDSGKALISSFSKRFIHESKPKLKMIKNFMSQLAFDDINRFISTLQEMKTGLFNVNKRETEKIYISSSDTIFNETIKILKSGKKDIALGKFKNFYNERKLGFEIRSKSLYNIILIHIDQLKSKEAGTNILAWFSLYKENKKRPNLSEAQFFIDYLLAHQDIEKAAAAATSLFYKLCEEKKVAQATKYFNQAFIYHRSISKNDDLTKITIKAINCSINKKTVSILVDSTLKNFKTLNHIDDFLKMVNLFNQFNNSYINKTVFDNLFDFYNYLTFQKNPRAGELKSLLLGFKDLRHKNKKLFLRQLKVEKIVSDNKAKKIKAFKMPENHFSQTLEQRLNDLSNLSKKIEKQLRNASLMTTYIGLQLLINEYQKLSLDLDLFLKANQIDKALLGDLKNLGKGLKNQKEAFLSTFNSLLKSNFEDHYPTTLPMGGDIDSFYTYRDFSTPLPVDYGGNL